MSRTKLEFWLLTSFFLITRCWDITATYVITPDLEKETNPIVSIFGQGWMAVIIFQIILASVVIILNYYSLFKIKNSYPSQKGYSFKDFITYYYFGEKRSLIKMLYKFPKNKSVLIKALGYILPRSLIVISVFISLSSTLLIVSSDYQKFYAAAKPCYYVILIAIVSVFYVLFFKKEYTIYQNILADT